MEEQMALQNILFIPVKVCIKALNDIFNAITLIIIIIIKDLYRASILLFKGAYKKKNLKINT